MQAIDGVSNFRDLGGLPLVGGGVTRQGRLLRSATLRSLSDTGVDQLKGIPVADIVDLRTRAEDRLDSSGSYHRRRDPTTGYSPGHVSEHGRERR